MVLFTFLRTPGGSSLPRPTLPLMVFKMVLKVHSVSPSFHFSSVYKKPTKPVVEFSYTLYCT